MMSTKKYRIRLTTDEQQELNALVSRGRAAAYKQTHARILLMSDESRSDGGMKDADITSALGVGQSTVERIRKRCVEEGVSIVNRGTPSASSEMRSDDCPTRRPASLIPLLELTTQFTAPTCT